MANNDSSIILQSAETSEQSSLNSSIESIFKEYTNDINIYLRKYFEYYVNSLREEQKTLDELDEFHASLVNHEQLLNVRLGRIKEELLTFQKKIALITVNVNEEPSKKSS